MQLIYSIYRFSMQALRITMTLCCRHSDVLGADQMLSCWVSHGAYAATDSIHRTHKHTHTGSYRSLDLMWFDSRQRYRNAKSSAPNFKCGEIFKCQCRPNPLKSNTICIRYSTLIGCIELCLLHHLMCGYCRQSAEVLAKWFGLLFKRHHSGIYHRLLAKQVFISMAQNLPSINCLQTSEYARRFATTFGLCYDP